MDDTSTRRLKNRPLWIAVLVISVVLWTAGFIHALLAERGGVLSLLAFGVPAVILVPE